jgi:hypothetical protein
MEPKLQVTHCFFFSLAIFLPIFVRSVFADSSIITFALLLDTILCMDVTLYYRHWPLCC